MEDVLLKVKNLTVHYVTRSETVKAVNNVSFELRKGETIGLVGETGAGKTTIARTIMHILPAPPAQIVSGTVELEGEDLYKKSETELEKIRGNKMAMVFQDPMTALNPVKRVGWQIAEGIRMHQKISKEDADKKALEIFEMVGIPAERFREYPHQFSGGMKQRVVIAIALACNPDLLICDEPTTALDVTIQAQVLDMITDLKKKRNMALIMITHDLAIVAETCDKVAVVYAGQIVEYGTVRQLFKNPSHPYSLGLFGAIPMLDKDVHRLSPINGAPPDPTHLPEGCYFRTRCPYVTDACRSGDVAVVDMGEGHLCKCCRFDKKQEG